MFQDVHPGGVAAAAGVESGDILLAIDDQDLIPPTALPFRLGHSYGLTLRKPSGSTARVTLQIAGSREKKRPIVVPNQVVCARRLEPDVGYRRVSMFPGVLGMDVARDISRSIEELNCEHLVIDLRGNTGGGIGCLRLMSHLCPDRRGVGYSIGRKLANRGYDKSRLPQFERIPTSKLRVLPLILKFGLAGGDPASDYGHARLDDVPRNGEPFEPQCTPMQRYGVRTQCRPLGKTCAAPLPSRRLAAPPGL